MKYLQILIVFSLIFLSCESSKKNTDNISQQSEIQQDTLQKAEKSQQALVLSDHALQLVDQVTGSSNELPFGTQEQQLTEIINNILQSKPISTGVNSECGAGPLKMVTWNNGLTVVFQENNTKSADSKTDWLFQGWHVNAAKENATNLTTMAGIGIGSTLAETQSAYEIEVKKTTLGQEFSTASGFYGILDGVGEDAKINHLWSGVSCSFR